MSGNRFEFLEFGEEGKPPGVDQADGPGDVRSLPPAQEPQGPRDAQGRPLAQVRADDLPGGYGVFLAAPDADSGRATAGARDADGAGARLRVAEVIGGRGTQAGQFNSPTGLALDSGGVLYVADSYNHRLQRITPSGGVALVGGRGSGRGQFLSPQGVATDARAAFYIVEQGNNRVQKFSAQGVLELIFGRAGAGDGELRGPTGIAVAPGTGDILVVDAGNRRVQRFDAEGNFLATLGARGGIYPPLVRPQSVAVDDRGNVYVADTFAHRIVCYDALGRQTAPVAAAGLHEPRALAWDPSGLLYVADTAPGQGLEAAGRLQALDARTGATRAGVSRAGGTGAPARPGGVAVRWTPDPAGRGLPGEVYVSDTMNHRVLRFVWS